MSLPDCPAPPPPVEPPPPAAVPRAAGESTAAAVRPRPFVVLVSLLVLAFAFLAASFPARNSDLWFHLAAGRLIAEGGYHFGADPFAYTTDNVYWANPSWLSELLLYAGYVGLGGAGLVVVKAGLIAALAGVLLLIRRRDGAAGVPAVCAALALLALSPRLLLQPACLSYLFLGLTLWLLWRRADRPDEASAPGPWRWGDRAVLLLLFAAWANLDEWFGLGPLLAGLFWAGGRLEGRRHTPGWLPVLGLAACLLNPHGYRVFALPAELSPALWDSGLRDDPRFARLFASPWTGGPALWSAAGVNFSAGAYFALVGAGLISFALNARALGGWRLPVWLAFGLLGAATARGVPFFAVVAGPVLALNVQDALARRRRPSARAVTAWRVTAVASLLGLVGLAWLGSLQGWCLEGRRAAWAVQPDPSLRRLAESLPRLRGDGRLSEGERGFAFHPEVAHYCAWFCRGEKNFFDHRLALFPQAAGDYERVCQELCPGLRPTTRPARPAARGWRAVFREHGIGHVILYDADPVRLLNTLSRLHGDAPEWALVHVDGQAVVFRWRGAGRETEPAPGFDAERLAFGRARPGEADDLPPAPGGVGRGPRPPRWWAHDGRPAAPPAWESAAANVYLRLFEDSAPGRHKEGAARAWLAYDVGLRALPALPGDAASASAALALRGVHFRYFLPHVGELPPALPLLAVRADRRALADNPDDAGAWLRLAHAYRALRDDTCEHSREGRLPPLAMLRYVQVVTALHNALVRNPDLLPAHQNLAELFAERQYLDLALEHRRAELALARAGKPLPGEDADEFRRRLEGMADRLRELEELVQERSNRFVVGSEPLRDNPLGRARLALGLGLARKALDDVLLRSRELLFGVEGAKLEMELLLLTGRADEAGALLGDEEVRQARQVLGAYDVPGVDAAGALTFHRLSAYEWLSCCQAAAVGDYDRAADALREMSDYKGMQGRQITPLRRALARYLATELGVRPRPGPVFVGNMVVSDREELTTGLAEALRMPGEQADLLVVAALLDLERGEPASARQLLRKARAACPDGGPSAPFFAGRGIAEAYSRYLERP